MVLAEIKLIPIEKQFSHFAQMSFAFSIYHHGCTEKNVCYHE